MKTKLLLIIIAFSLFLLKVNAQSFLLQTLSGTNINYGDTVVIYGNTNDFILNASLTILNSSASPKPVQVQRQILNLVPGADFFFIWGLTQYPPFANNSIDPVIIDAGDSTSEFVGGYITYNIPGISHVRYRFCDENNPPDSAWLVFQYNVTQAVGLNDFYVDNNLSVFPNASTGIFNITLNETFSKASAEIYDSNGNLIFIKSISNQSKHFKIDLSSRPNGIYTLRLKGEKNGYIKTLKLVKI